MTKGNGVELFMSVKRFFHSSFKPNQGLVSKSDETIRDYCYGFYGYVLS